jgi:hypothetical protein
VIAAHPITLRFPLASDENLFVIRPLSVGVREDRINHAGICGVLAKSKRAVVPHLLGRTQKCA